MDDLVDGYVDVVGSVIDYGRPVTVRGLETWEVLGATIVVDNPCQTLPLGVGRKCSPKVAAVETLQLIGGFTDPVLTCKASDAFEKVKDGGAFHGAYGPRAAPQFPRVVDRLRADPASRRAMVNIWDPAHDLYREGLHDYPCTVSLEYTIRDGRLIAQTHMRSNDVWLGLAYDAFVFTQVQLTLCHILGVEPGKYIHHASSLHIYEENLGQVDQLQKSGKSVELPTGVHAQSWDAAQGMAYVLAYHDLEWVHHHKWYARIMKELRNAPVVG